MLRAVDTVQMVLDVLKHAVYSRHYCNATHMCIYPQGSEFPVGNNLFCLRYQHCKSGCCRTKLSDECNLTLLGSKILVCLLEYCMY